MKRQPEELWTVETAKAWLKGYDWGHSIVATFEENAEPDRCVAWVRMVMGMHSVMRRHAAAMLAAPDEDDDVDLAGWPALVAEIYE